MQLSIDCPREWVLKINEMSIKLTGEARHQFMAHSCTLYQPALQMLASMQSSHDRPKRSGLDIDEVLVNFNFKLTGLIIDSMSGDLCLLN